MKKIIILLALPLFIYGCAAKKQYVKTVMNKVFIGMSISEFNQLVEKKELI